MPIINIGIGELKVSSNREDIFKTTVGSCLGIALFDNTKHTGGFAHIMLPKNKNPNDKNTKYADTAIAELIRIMTYRYGSYPKNIIAKIAGGGNMFAFKRFKNTAMNIGENNITAVKSILESKSIPIVGADVGKDFGRTIEFHIKDGALIISNSSNGKKEL